VVEDHPDRFRRCDDHSHPRTPADRHKPVLPVTCNGALKIMPKKAFTFRPGHITVTVGDPIPSEGLSEDDVPRLMDQTRAAVGKHLNPDYDPFR
jgi:1-acyl-sn-glycerol-3-phosphate acyltransferase